MKRHRSAMRHTTRRSFLSVLATILLLWLVIIARGATASEQEGMPQTPTPASPPERTALPIGSAPLTLTKNASTDTVLPGQSFVYTLRIATNRDQARVEVRDMLDRRVEVINIESASGTCTGAGMIVCTVQVTAQEPATILITVRAHATVAPDSWLISQALAQDDRDFTAASERVAVRVVAPPPSMSAPVATLLSTTASPSTGVGSSSDRQVVPESRPASHTSAILAPVLPPTATISPLLTAAPPLSRAASALTGATDPASTAPIETTMQELTPNSGEHTSSWLDLVTTIYP